MTIMPQQEPVGIVTIEGNSFLIYGFHQNLIRYFNPATAQYHASLSEVIIVRHPEDGNSADLYGRWTQGTPNLVDINLGFFNPENPQNGSVYSLEITLHNAVIQEILTIPGSPYISEAISFNFDEITWDGYIPASSGPGGVTRIGS